MSEYEAVSFNDYWWVIRKLKGGKFERWFQFLTEREARQKLDVIAAERRKPAPTLASLERQWIIDNGWSGKQ